MWYEYFIQQEASWEQGDFQTKSGKKLGPQQVQLSSESMNEEYMVFFL